MLRIKRAARADGQLQCNRCGCRTWLHVTAGGIRRNGRVVGATAIERYVCAHCYAKGINSSVLPPDLQPLEPSG